MGAIAPFSLFSHTPPAANTAVRSVRVSACRLLVVTMLTEGPSSSGVVRRMGAPPRRFAHRIQHAGPAAALTYSWSPGHCSGCVHGGLHSRGIPQHEHFCILSLPVGIYRNSSAGAPGRGPAKRNGPETSRDVRPEVNREGPARNKARGNGRTRVERKRSATTREDPTGKQAGVTGRTPIERKLSFTSSSETVMPQGGWENARGAGRRTVSHDPRNRCHLKQRSRDAAAWTAGRSREIDPLDAGPPCKGSQQAGDT